MELRHELMIKNDTIKKLEWKNENLRRTLQSNASFSPMKSIESAGGYEALVEFDDSDDEDDVQSRYPPSIVATPTGVNKQIAVSPTVAHLIRSNFRKAQHCNDQSKTLHLALEQLLAGKSEDAGKTLGCISKFLHTILHLL